MSESVAVIICTWNRAAVLTESLASLARVRSPLGKMVEVLVVDNNSKDDTQARLKNLASNWPLGRLHVLFEARQGKQFALNAGIARAREMGCCWLAFSDDDIVFPQDWLEQAAAVFSQDQLMLAGGRTELQWPGGSPPPWYDDSMSAIVGRVDLGPQRQQPPPAGYAPAGANLVARTELFERVGGFSEAHFRHMDFEFGQRCLARGEAVAYEPRLVVTAPVDAAMLTRRYFRRWSFKAGISPWQQMNGSVRHFAWVPLWLYRQLIQDVLGGPLAALKGESAALRFRRELRIWRSWGTCMSRWVSRLMPKAYPAWVERHSQKKRNVY